MSSLEKPQGQITRGKTARNRLRKADIFLILYDEQLLKRRSDAYQKAFFVDLGYGAEPFTTLESVKRLRRVNPDLPVLGVEIDEERVKRAVPFADDLTQFRLGGFNLPLYEGETVRVIRAFNVLRQYDEDQVRGAHQLMGNCLLPGGLIFEGTSDPFGRVWVANLLRKQSGGSSTENLVYEGLLFSTNFRWGFDPGLFQPVLPKNLIHRMVPGELIFKFMQDWKFAARETISYRELGLRQWFTASAQALAQRGYTIDLRLKLLKKGFLFWKRPDLLR